MESVWSFLILLVVFLLQYSKSAYFPKGVIKNTIAPLANKYLLSLLLIGSFVLQYTQKGLYTAIFVWMYQVALSVVLLQISTKLLHRIKIKK